MKITRVSSITILVFLSIVLLTSASLARDGAVDTALLWLNPASSTIPILDTTNIVLQLDDVTNVYGAEVTLSFDPTILAVEDANPGLGGVQIFTGVCPAPDFVVRNTADNTIGTIEYALTQINPTPPCDGGTVASIDFQCLSNGETPITITHTIIADSDGMEIDVQTQEAVLACNAAPNTPANPNPAHNATGIPTTLDLSWDGGDPDQGDTVTYDVLFGTSSPQVTLLCDDTLATNCDPGIMISNSTYYWQVIATDNHGAIETSIIWQFTTQQVEPNLFIYLPIVMKSANQTTFRGD